MNDDFTDWLVNREECIMDLDEEELKATRRLNGTAELTADEMFKRLGYSKSIVEEKIDIMSDISTIARLPEKRKYFRIAKVTIEYEENILDVDYPAKIIFSLKNKEISKEYKDYGDTIYSIPITMQELKAINKKCKELEWLDE